MEPATPFWTSNFEVPSGNDMQMSSGLLELSQVFWGRHEVWRLWCISGFKGLGLRMS